MLLILVSGPFSSMQKKRALSLVSVFFLTFSLAACEFNPFGDNAAEVAKQRNHELEVACITAGRIWYGGALGCANPLTVPNRNRPPVTLFRQTTLPPMPALTPTPKSPPTTSWFDRQKEEDKIRCIAAGGTWYYALGHCAIMPTLATTSPTTQFNKAGAIQDCLSQLAQSNSGVNEDVCYEMYG